jgi:lysosomal acid lipase/cholesteryl ester hydrolase
MKTRRLDLRCELNKPFFNFIAPKTLSTTGTLQYLKHRGLPFQTHYVTTKDGYILSLHRIPFSKAELLKNKSTLKNKRSQLNIESPSTRPVVLLWHGFLMCSEVWVSTPEFNENLAFTLAEAGYDVWLGNTRGNKYSCKHRKFKPSEENFWDFSMDQLALFDLPDSVDVIIMTDCSIF